MKHLCFANLLFTDSMLSGIHVLLFQGLYAESFKFSYISCYLLIICRSVAASSSLYILLSYYVFVSPCIPSPSHEMQGRRQIKQAVILVTSTSINCMCSVERALRGQCICCVNLERKFSYQKATIIQGKCYREFHNDTGNVYVSKSKHGTDYWAL